MSRASYIIMYRSRAWPSLSSRDTKGKSSEGGFSRSFSLQVGVACSLGTMLGCLSSLCVGVFLWEGRGCIPRLKKAKIPRLLSSLGIRMLCRDLVLTSLLFLLDLNQGPSD